MSSIWRCHHVAMEGEHWSWAPCSLLSSFNGANWVGGQQGQHTDNQQVPALKQRRCVGVPRWVVTWFLWPSICCCVGAGKVAAKTIILFLIVVQNPFLLVELCFPLLDFILGCCNLSGLLAAQLWGNSIHDHWKVSSPLNPRHHRVRMPQRSPFPHRLPPRG